MRYETILRSLAWFRWSRANRLCLVLVRFATLALLLSGVGASVEAGPVVAGPFLDPKNDFLSTYDPALPRTPDLDIRLAQVIYNPGAQTLQFIAEMWGTITLPTTAIYVWGIDHGHGTEQFELSGTPLTGAGVFFDQVMVVRPGGTTTLLGQTFTSQLSTRDNPNDTITLTVPVSSVPATQAGDRPVEQWGFNLWPRPGTPGFGNGNNVITDFGPDAADLLPTVVPEPLSIVAMGSGVGMVLVLSVWRRKATGTA